MIIMDQIYRKISFDNRYNELKNFISFKMKSNNLKENIIIHLENLEKKINNNSIR